MVIKFTTIEWAVIHETEERFIQILIEKCERNILFGNRVCDRSKIIVTETGGENVNWIYFFKSSKLWKTCVKTIMKFRIA